MYTNINEDVHLIQTYALDICYYKCIISLSFDKCMQVSKKKLHIESMYKRHFKQFMLIYIQVQHLLSCELNDTCDSDYRITFSAGVLLWLTQCASVSAVN